MQIDQLQGAVKTFGRELFAYCLNVDPAEIETIEADVDGMSDSRLAVLASMVNVLTSVKVRAAIAETPLELLVSDLAVLDDSGKKSSIFNMWRSQCGGAVPDFHTGDAVGDALAPGLAYVYPATLIFRHLTGAPWRFTSTPRYPYDSEYLRSFSTAVLEDPALSHLFPIQDGELFDIASSFLSNTGRAGGMQLAVLSDAIFNSAYMMFRLRRQTAATDLRDAVVTTLRLLRAAATGGSVAVPAWIGIGNIALPENVELPWGRLGPYPYPTELEVIPPEARPSTTTDEQGSSYTLGAILETTFQYELTVSEPTLTSDIDVSWPASMKREHAKLSEIFTHTSIAAMLASERNPLAACTRLWTAIFDPFSFGTHLSFRTDSMPPVTAHILSSSEMASMRDWAEKLRSTAVKKIEIAQRRIISAVAERRDPVDGLVDAIIAWESLFAGTDQGELSFHICAAMAKLLFQSRDDRLAEHRRLLQLYTKRSKVLHGAQEIDPSDATQSRDYAIRAILDCIKKLYMEYPDLLQDADRSRKIILGL